MVEQSLCAHRCYQLKLGDFSHARVSLTLQYSRIKGCKRLLGLKGKGVLRVFYCWGTEKRSFTTQHSGVEGCKRLLVLEG